MHMLEKKNVSDDHSMIARKLMQANYFISLYCGEIWTVKTLKCDILSLVFLSKKKKNV